MALVRLASCVGREEQKDPPEPEADRRPLPLTSCENMGGSVAHPEAVYSSAKWTQKHLLSVLHGRWSERCENSMQRSIVQLRGAPRTSGQQQLWADMRCAWDVRCALCLADMRCAKTPSSRPGPTVLQWPLRQQVALDAVRATGRGLLPRGSRVGSLGGDPQRARGSCCLSAVRQMRCPQRPSCLNECGNPGLPRAEGWERKQNGPG